MKNRGLLSVWFTVLWIGAWAQSSNPIVLGILTDVQYCDCDPLGIRNYRLSAAKLDSCVAAFDTLPLDAIFCLGDMIDHQYESYDTVLPRFRNLKAPFYPVPGNHDYMIRGARKQEVPGLLGLQNSYYAVDLGGWLFLALNGNDLSYFAPQSKAQKKERNEMVSDLFSSLRFSGMAWNGGIGKAQAQWLKEQLSQAEEEGKKVILLCHFPLVAPHNHTLFNNREIFALIQPYSCVKAWFCGHYHSGGYQENDGIHLVNFHGMVDTPVNAFATVTLTDDSILISGYGREPSRNLPIRKTAPTAP